jgi:hypothetical protein
MNRDFLSVLFYLHRLNLWKEALKKQAQRQSGNGQVT